MTVRDARTSHPPTVSPQRLELFVLVMAVSQQLRAWHTVGTQEIAMV